MNAYKWIVVGWLAFSVLMTVTMVGKPRQPLSGNIAAATIVITGALIFCVVRA